MSNDTHEVYAVRYAHHGGRNASMNFIGGDPHQASQDLAFYVWAIVGPQGTIVADLSIARGLDYYTGTVYETRLLEYPTLGSICSGGRYDNLAGSFINRKLPGVGISLGLTRLFAKLIAEQRLPLGPKCPTQVLVVLPLAELREETASLARLLRERGLNVEMYHTPGKIANQLRYAARKGIPYVWFPPFDEGGKHEVKNMITQQQTQADPTTWTPQG